MLRFILNVSIIPVAAKKLEELKWYVSYQICVNYLIVSSPEDIYWVSYQICGPYLRYYRVFGEVDQMLFWDK